MRKIVLCSIVMVLCLLATSIVFAGQPAAQLKAPIAQPLEDNEQSPQFVPPPIQRAPASTATIINVPGSYATIQLAIDNATNGDTIIVAAGTYSEAILIDGKNLTIQGAGAGSSFITGTITNTTYIVKMDNSAVVDLSGFTIDGTGKNIAYGIYAFTGVDGDIHDNEVKNIVPTNAGGLAIRRQECYIDVTNNDVYGFGRIGIYTRDDVIGNTDTGVISGNTVTGLGGLDPDRLSYGISVYSGNPTIDNNDIYDCISGANVAQWASAGLDPWTGSTAIVSNNNFYNCEYGILSNSASPVMSGNTFTGTIYDDVRLDYFVKGNPTPHWAEYYDTIQDAIDAIPGTTLPVIVWIGVYSGGGTYAEAVNINKSCHIWGDSRATVLVDAVGHAVNGAGIYIAADGVLLSGLTLQGSNTNSTPRYGIKFGDYDGCYLDDAEVRNLYRTGVDVLGATNLSVTNVELKDNGGNGLQLCDASNVTLEDITTSNNSWGGIGIFTWGQYTPIGTSGIVFSGTNSFGETSADVGSIYLEEGNSADPLNPYPITYSTDILDGADVTLQLADVTHALNGNSDNDNEYTRFYATLGDAQTAAAGAVSHILDGRYITELAGTNLYVPSNLGGIQPAVDAANPYDVVHVAAGLYDERVIIDKALTLEGATHGVSKKGYVVPPLYAYDSNTESIIKPSLDVDQPMVKIMADEVVLDGFVVANEVCGGGGTRDLVSVHYGYDAPIGIQVLNNVLGPNTNTALQDGTMSRSGLVTVGPRSNPLKFIARDNKIFDSKGNGCGIMLVGPYGTTYHGGTTYMNYFSGSVIENNEITGNHRSGIELAGGVQGGTNPAEYFMIKNNLITNNGWFSLADKDNLKYGHGIMFIRGGSDRGLADANGAQYISIEDNVITGNEKSGFYFGPINSDIFSSNNLIDNNGLGTGGYSLWDGVHVDLDETYYSSGTYTDYGRLDNLAFTNNSISGNGSYGMQVIQTPSLGPVSALSNWWGDATGPYHATSNPGGLGNDVSDNVLFNPMLSGLNQVTVVPADNITNCSTNLTYTFHIEQPVTAQEIRGYNLQFQIDPLVVTTSTGAITEGAYLDAVGDGQFFAIDNGGGLYTVSCAILGGSVGATGAGDLFTVEFTPVGEGTSAITIASLLVRDLNNVPLSSGGTDGSIQVDCTVPTMEPIVEAQGQYYNTAPTFANFGFDDDVNLDMAEYQIDSDGWVSLFSGIDAAAWDNDPWTLPGFGGLAEGPHTVHFRVKDDAGNWNGEGTPDTYSWQFFKDTVAPDPPSDFTAAPGNIKVHLAWTNPTGDPSFVGVEIRRVGWRDYPQYATAAPDYPADETEGTFVVQTGSEAYDDDPVNPRDIYYFAAFSYDVAGNYSVFDAGAADRATNYWLGDIDSTGTVDPSDLATFSGTFGTAEGGGGFIPESDFGPSDDWSRFGIPEPDDVINFEDLMIFAMNYGNVSAAGTSKLIAASPASSMSDNVSISLMPLSSTETEATIAVVIDNKASHLKGINLVVDYGLGNDLVRVERGSALAGKGGDFFGTIPQNNGSIDISVAALGVGKAFEGSGEIARLVIKQDPSNPAHIKLKKIDLRDVSNTKEEIVVESDINTPFIPSVSTLKQNHPNPFNPVTTITYDVAVSGRVTLQIFDVSGHLVQTLVDNHRDPGRYDVEWNGRDSNGITVPSGVYFYRMKAPGYQSPARKMVLIK